VRTDQGGAGETKSAWWSHGDDGPRWSQRAEDLRRANWSGAGVTGKKVIGGVIWLILLGWTVEFEDHSTSILTPRHQEQ